MENERKKLNLLNKTKFIIISLKDLRFYNMINLVQDYLKVNRINNLSRFKDTPTYFLLTWNKLFLIEDTIRENPFNTNYFGWIDFGIYHVIRGSIPDRYLYNISNKIKIMEINYTDKSETDNLTEYCSRLRYKIAGGLFTASSDRFIKFINLFKQKLFFLLFCLVVDYDCFYLILA